MVYYDDDDTVAASDTVGFWVTCIWGTSSSCLPSVSPPLFPQVSHSPRLQHKVRFLYSVMRADGEVLDTVACYVRVPQTDPRRDTDPGQLVSRSAVFYCWLVGK